MPKLLSTVDAAVINGNFALLGGLIPKRGDYTPTHKEAIYLEDKDSLPENVKK